MNDIGRACSMHAEKRGTYRILVGKLREGDYLEELGVDGRIMLKCIFKNWDGWEWTALIRLRIGTGVGLF
jgi:hypothetical protein